MPDFNDFLDMEEISKSMNAWFTKSASPEERAALMALPPAFGGVMGALSGAISQHLAKRSQAAHDELRNRVKLLELGAGRTMKFMGPHQPGDEYLAGAVVQRSGAAWVAVIKTAGKPGESTDWRRLGKEH